MQRISTLNRVLNLFGAGKDGFRNGDLANGIVPTEFNAAWCNSIQEELANVVEAAGIALDVAQRTQLLSSLQKMARESGAPGQLGFWATTTPPTGWIKANGAAVSRTVYAALFSAVGTTYGAGDGATTFNVPELRGEFLRGWDDGRGIDVGRALGAWQKGTLVGGYDDDGVGANASLLLSKGAGIDYGSDPVVASQYTSASGVYLSGVSSTVATVGSNFFSVTRPRNMAGLACIKY